MTYCSFCGTSNLRKPEAMYVQAKDVAICSECVERCRDLIGYRRRQREMEAEAQEEEQS